MREQTSEGQARPARAPTSMAAAGGDSTEDPGTGTGGTHPIGRGFGGNPVRSRSVARRRVEAFLGALLVVQCLGLSGHALADTVPPVIEHQPIEQVPAGGSTEIDATVTDDESGVSGVFLNLRLPGRETFGAPLTMDDRGAGRYSGRLSADGASPGETVEYFITATDGEGNSESRGFEFDPFSVRVVEPRAAVEVPPVRESGGRRALYVLGAVVTAGLVAWLLSDGGGEPEPGTPTLCCRIVVE